MGGGEMGGGKMGGGEMPQEKAVVSQEAQV